MTHHLDLSTFTLKKGNHTRRGKESVCVMEAVAWWAGEKHSDRPECVSTVIGAFLRRWNDDLDDTGRQMLLAYVPKVVGTATGPEDESRRAWMVTDWMVRTYLPAWLRLAKLDEQASAVEALAELVDADSWSAGHSSVESARRDAAAAGDAAWAAAGDAAGAAAGAAAGDAAGAAAWAAARAAARDAAGDAAGDAAWAAAWAAARAAARAAAGDAAGAAAWAAAWAAARAAAGAAAGDAARDALRPAVEGLQKSALDLLDRLIEVGKVAS